MTKNPVKRAYPEFVAARFLAGFGQKVKNGRSAPLQLRVTNQ
jgi:hypothetical protein